MDPIEIMKRPAAYASGYENTPVLSGPSRFFCPLR